MRFHNESPPEAKDNPKWLDYIKDGRSLKVLERQRNFWDGKKSSTAKRFFIEWLSKSSSSNVKVKSVAAKGAA